MSKRKLGRKGKSPQTKESDISYYAKHREARREYQNRYNQIRRITRRKLSKTDLEALRKRRTDELDGVIPVFENRICRQNMGIDPERTNDMEAEEGKLAHELNSLKWTICEEQSRLRHIYAEDDWITTYVKELCTLRDIALAHARSWMDMNRDLKGTHEWKEEVHGKRRIVAIYHQEIDLYRQGAEIPVVASRSNELIADGFRVNKTEFRQVYRF